MQIPQVEECDSAGGGELLEANYIEPFYSPWESPVEHILKKDSMRRCIDYWKQKGITKPDLNTMPRVEELIDGLSQAQNIYIYIYIYQSSTSLGTGRCLYSQDPEP